MATDQLALYNVALFSCGERALASTSEDREPRHLLDEIWTRGGGATPYFLEQGLWNFATTRASLAPSTSTSPSFQYTNSFALPSDYVRLVMISSSSGMSDPLFDYKIEGANIQANGTALYLTYVSNSTNYGGDLSKWPDTFILWAGHWLATQLAPRLKNEIDLESLKKTTAELLVSARLKNAAETSTPWPPIRFDEIDHRHLDHVLELLTVRGSPAKEER